MGGGEGYYVDEVVGGRSLCFYSCFLMFGIAAKCFTLRCVHPCFQMMAFDITAAFVIYGCAFCHGYIANSYGPIGYLIALISVGVMQRVVLCGSANPLPHIIKLIECPNSCEKDAALWRIGMVMVGGLIAHPFAKLLWIGLMPDVEPYALEHMHCVMPSPSARAPIFVPLAAGIEFLGSLIICAMYHGSTVSASIDAYELCTKFFLGCFFSCLDSSYTAIHLNPTLAGSMLFGCACDEVIKAMAIYWLAPLIAAIGFACGCCCPWPSPCFALTCSPTCTTVCPTPSPPPCPPPCPPCSPTSSCPLPCPKPCPKPCPPPCQPSCSLPCPKPCPPTCPVPCPAPCVQSVCPLPCPSTNNCGPQPSCPRPCDPKGQITAQMRQLNKDGQKQVNYVICIPPMCTEKGVRLQHKFVVNKDEDDEGGAYSIGTSDGRGDRSGKTSTRPSSTYRSGSPSTRAPTQSSRQSSHGRSSKSPSSKTTNTRGETEHNASSNRMIRSDTHSMASNTVSNVESNVPSNTASNTASHKTGEFSNTNVSNRRRFQPVSMYPDNTGPIDIKLNDNGAQRNNNGWMMLTPTIKRKTSNSGRPSPFQPITSSDASD